MKCKSKRLKFIPWPFLHFCNGTITANNTHMWQITLHIPLAQKLINRSQISRSARPPPFQSKNLPADGVPGPLDLLSSPTPLDLWQIDRKGNPPVELSFGAGCVDARGWGPCRGSRGAPSPLGHAAALGRAVTLGPRRCLRCASSPRARGAAQGERHCHGA